MTSLQQSLTLVEHSPDFLAWKEKHRDSFLCSFFRIRDGKNDDTLQVDFYTAHDDTMSSFVIEHGVVALRQDNAEVLKKEGEVIQHLNLDHVTIEEHEALEKAETLCLRKYGQEKIIKFIIILQHKEQPRWNISALTHSLHLLNVKIDAQKGNILEESITNLLAFVQHQDE